MIFKYGGTSLDVQNLYVRIFTTTHGVDNKKKYRLFSLLGML